MNRIQKSVAWMFEKATGFPIWRSLSLLDPSGWGDSSYTGTNVQGLAALQLATVWGCASVLGRATMLPIDIVQKTGSSRKILENHYLTELLNVSPNPLMTWTEFFEAMMLSFDLWGNAYAEKRYISKRLGAMYPLDPSRMRIVVENGDVRYEYAQKSGQLQKFNKQDILHVKNFSLDGITGLSPIACLREVVGRGVDAQRFGANYLRNGGQPTGVLQHPKTLGDEARKKMRKDWKELHGGPNNSHEIAILWEGMEYKAIGFNPEDLQYIELMKATKAEIAEAYGVPLNLLAQSDKTSTYASAEQFDLQFVKYTIAPRCKRFESAFKKSLLANEPGVSAKFNLDALLRGDAASRASFFSTMVQNGIMTRNEVRAKNDLDPIKGGDDLTVQSNMLDLDKLSKLAAAPQPAPIVNA